MARRKTSIVTWIVLLSVVGIAASFLVPSKSPSTVPSAAAAPKPKTQAEQEADQRTIAAASALKLLKGSVRDPDSFQLESVRANDGGSLICIEYRARNGFGGMNRSFVAFADGRALQSVGEWNKRCTRQLHDVAAPAEQLLELLSR